MQGRVGAAGVRCGVLGSPIGHSLSPVLHRAAYARLGLTDWSYDAHEVDESSLPSFLASLGPEWRGLSLTMPLKRVMIPLCDEVDPLARSVEAVNTVVFSRSGRRRGSNTDVPGATAALRAHGVSSASTALLIGAGATAGSALAGLVDLGVRRATAVVREVSRAAALQDLAKRLDVELTVVPWSEVASRAGLPTADVAVSTVPADAVDNLDVPADVVFDVIYHPWPTPLAVAAELAGRVVVSGLDLLVHQAALQVELMTGLSPAPIHEMRAAAEAELEARA